jgi:3-oxoacyl-[acyl-carrier protein] reductase
LGSTPGPLSGRKVLITGGSRGIGAACAWTCNIYGATVGILYNRSEKKASDLAQKILSDSGGSFIYKADVADFDSVRNAASAFSSAGRIEGIQGVVVNAGIYDRRSFDDLDGDHWRRTMAVNLDGAYNTVKAALPHMRSGAIVLVSSQLAFRGTQHGADYAASKAGILGLGRSLALELAPRIRVNMVAPGFVDTDILANDPPEKRAQRISQVPLGRIGSPEEISEAIAFLLSDKASYVTGATLDANGGLFIH